MRLVLALMVSLILMACDNNADAQNTGVASMLTITSADKSKHDFHVELALTPAQQQKGLMNRTSMAPNAGMLFIFGQEREQSFWMKNTLIPLDIIFLKKDGTIHHIHENAVPNDLTPIPSNGAAAATLELNGGRAKALGIKEGDVVHHVMFGNALQ